MTATAARVTATERGRRTAVRAAALFDGVGPGTVTDPVVVIENGRIAAVAQGAGAVPRDAVLVDLPGATLLPGLIDVHVHLAMDAGPDPVGVLEERDDPALLDVMTTAASAQLAAGVTTVRDLGDRGYLSMRLPDGPVRPTVVPSGPPITIAGGHCHFLGGVAHGVHGVRAAVREHVDRGVSVIKVIASGGNTTPGSDPCRAQFAPKELAALVDEAHRHGLPVTAHAHGYPAIADAVAAGVDGLEHCTFLTPDGVRAPNDLLAAIVDRRIVVSGTLGRVPSTVPGPPTPEVLVRSMPTIVATHRRLIADGAVFVVGTDAGVAPVKPHGVLPRGLADLRRFGMSAADALRCGTSTAARVCGLGDRKGRVAPGFDADLLAVDGDPTSDLTALRRPVAVLVEGKRIDLAT